MNDRALAHRYAKALYDVARQTSSVDDVLQGMKNLALAIRESSQFEKVLFNPLIKSEEKVLIVKSVTSNKLILKFIAYIARRKRTNILPQIYEHFLNLTDEAKGIKRILVKTAMNLTEAERKGVEQDLAKKMRGTIMGQFEVAKDLIGGVWIKMGDKVLDATLKGKIDDLRHVLAHSTN